MSIGESLNWAIRQLKQSISAQLDAEVLLAHVLKRDRVYLVAHATDTLQPEADQSYRSIIEKRLTGRPVAYLTGHKEFYGFDFSVTPAVLIPRPETELAVEAVIQMATANSSAHIADIGTGSGAIAIALKKTIPAARVSASDISPEAVTVAQTNAAHHDVTIEWKHGDLLAPFEKNSLDIIVANLPYLDPAWITQQELAFEPRQALAAGTGGLEVINRFLEQLTTHQPRAAALLEIDPRQEQTLRESVSVRAPHHRLAYAKDASGLTRLAVLLPT